MRKKIRDGIFHIGAIIVHWFVDAWQVYKCWRVGVPSFASLHSYDEMVSRNNRKDPGAYFESFANREIEIPEWKAGEVEYRMQSPMDTGSEVNDTIIAKIYSRNKGAKKVIIFTGMVFVGYRWPEHYLANRYLVSDEYDVCMVCLPGHGPRTATPYNGTGWMSSDPMATAEKCIQSILDVSRVYDALNSSYEEIYGTGICLGGTVISVLAYMRPIKAATLIITGSPMADTFWDGDSRFMHDISLETRKNYSLDQVRKLWEMSDVSVFEREPYTNRVLLERGMYDGFVTKDQVQNIAKAYSGAVIKDYPVSHLSGFLGSKMSFTDARKFFDGKEV